MQNWKHLLNCYSIEPQIHRKTALAAVRQKRAVHRQPGGYHKQKTFTNQKHLKKKENAMQFCEL